MGSVYKEEILVIIESFLIRKVVDVGKDNSLDT